MQPAVKKHPRTGTPYWTLISGSSVLPRAELDVPLTPQPSETGARAPITFMDEVHTGKVVPGIHCHIDKAWWQQRFGGVTWEEFRASGVTVLGTSMGILTGLLPEPGQLLRRQR
jgi:hypothetical protein